MELLQLRYFYESAKNQSFAKTAEEHLVPASSVSASVKRLEDELGSKLFDRQSNRITLNENGKALQRACMLIFDELESTVNSIRNAPPANTEIKVLILSLRERMMTAMTDYQRSHPAVSFEATFNVNDQDIDKYDLIIDKEARQYPEHKKIELCSYQLCFRTAKNSPLIGKELTMRDLRHQPFITMETENELDSVLFESCKSAGFYPRIVMRTNDQQCYKHYTLSGLGISLWRKYQSSPQDNLTELSVSDFYARQTMCMYYKPSEQNGTLSEFIDFLKQRDF